MIDRLMKIIKKAYKDGEYRKMLRFSEMIEEEYKEQKHYISILKIPTDEKIIELNKEIERCSVFEREDKKKIITLQDEIHALNEKWYKRAEQVTREQTAFEDRIKELEYVIDCLDKGLGAIEKKEDLDK